jgi:hypothetical protein
MSTVQKSLRIPKDVVEAIEALAELAGQDFSATAIELLTEAVKMRRCPGIIFADGPSGRRVRLAGSGMDVWEVIATYQSLDRDLTRLRQAYPWLTEAQLRNRSASWRYRPEPRLVPTRALRRAPYTNLLPRCDGFANASIGVRRVLRPLSSWKARGHSRFCGMGWGLPAVSWRRQGAESALESRWMTPLHTFPHHQHVWGALIASQRPHLPHLLAEIQRRLLNR